MLTTIIIDDDEIAIFRLTKLLKNLSSYEIQIKGTALNLADGIELIKETQPDLVFLDICMSGKNGLEIFNEFKPPFFKIIFCTAYEQYAIDVLKNIPCGFLVKPIDFLELKEAVQKVFVGLSRGLKYLLMEEKMNYMNLLEIPGENILFDVVNGFISFNTRNIEYCYASQSYSVIVNFDKKENLLTKPLRELQNMFPENQFHRTHKSYLVNIYHIRKYIHAKESYVLLRCGIKIPVSVRATSTIVEDIKQKLQLGQAGKK